MTDSSHNPTKLVIRVRNGFNVDQPHYAKRVPNYVIDLPKYAEVEYNNERPSTTVSAAAGSIAAHNGFVRGTDLTTAWEEEERKV